MYLSIYLQFLLLHQVSLDHQVVLFFLDVQEVPPNQNHLAGLCHLVFPLVQAVLLGL